MITLVILMNCILNDIATCNFLFQWLCLHFTVTNDSCQVWLCTKKSANTFIDVVHLTMNFFSNYQHLVVVFSAALSPSIAIHSLLLKHFTNNSSFSLSRNKHGTKKYIWNRPVEEAKKMKCYKRLIYKQFVQISGLCGPQCLS